MTPDPHSRPLHTRADASPEPRDGTDSGPRLLLLEDRNARSWHPFATTRPVSELLFGTLLLRERIETAAGVRADAILGSPALAGFEEPGTPPVLAHRGRPGRELPPPPDTGPGDRPTLVISSRWVPDLESGGVGEADDGDPGPDVSPGDDTPDTPIPDAPSARVLEEVVQAAIREDRPIRLELGPGPEWLVGWCLPPGCPIPGEESGHLSVNPGGGLLESPWALMAGNSDRVARDLMDARLRSHPQPLDPPEGVSLLGRFAVTAEPGVRIEAGAILDARSGPIHLSAGVRVDPLTHLAGPAFIGEGSQLLGGRIGALSTGPVCKIGGEVSEVVLLGYVNKAHDGYLGHALVGRWVNLGAGTTNSDLKNNYGTVRAHTSAETREDTGLMKAGVLLGDHVKTAIGTLLNTGTVVGAGSNLFGGSMPDAWVPPFSWGSTDPGVHRFEAFRETARRAMERRGVELPSGTATVLERAWRVEHGGGGRPSGP